MFLLTLGDKETAANEPSTFASVQQLNEEPMRPETLAQINANGFQASSFVSSAATGGKVTKPNKVTSEKVLINLDAETVSVPMHAAVEAVDPVFNPTVRTFIWSYHCSIIIIGSLLNSAAIRRRFRSHG